MNIYASKVKEFKKEEDQVLYRGINSKTGKPVTVVSYGHLPLQNNWICIFAATAGRFLMALENVVEVKECITRLVYVCD